MKTKITILLIVTCGFLLWVLRDIDIGRAKLALQQTEPVYVCCMFGGYLLSHLLRSVRLWVLLEKKTSYYRVLSINTVGFLAINVMPMRLGEAVRPYLFMEREFIPFGHALAAIFLERLLDMCMLLIMLMGVGFFIQLPDQGLLISGIDVLSAGQKAAGGIVVLGVLGILALIFLSRQIFGVLETFSFLRPVVGIGRKFRDAILVLLEQPRKALFLFFLSCVVWLLTIASVWMALLAFSDVPHGFDVAWSCWTITLAGMTAIPTPGFFGVYELCCSAVLSLWNVSPTLSKTFALSLHLGQIIFISVLGSYFMLREGLSLRAVSFESKE